MEETLNTSVYNRALTHYMNILWKGSSVIISVSSLAMIVIYIAFGILEGFWSDWKIILPPAVLGIVDYLICHYIYNHSEIKVKRACMSVFFSVLCLLYSFFFIRLNFMVFIFCFPVITIMPCGKRTIIPTFVLGELLNSLIYVGHQIYCIVNGYAYGSSINHILSMYVISLVLIVSSFVIAMCISDVFRVTILETEKYARQSEKNYQRATHDPLTGAYNKEKIKIDMDKYDFTSVAFIDLDDFKHFNTDYSHEVGDGVLKTLVECLSEELGATGRVYRYGGDEFTVLGFADKDTIAESIQKASKDFKSKIWLSFKAEGSFSAGVSLWDPKLSTSENISKADELMYKVKDNGKDSILVC